MSKSQESMFTSLQDLEELTGHARPAIQMRWLRMKAIPFIIGGDGRPKILRQTLLARFALAHAEADTVAPAIHLNRGLLARDPGN